MGEKFIGLKWQNIPNISSLLANEKDVLIQIFFKFGVESDHSVSVMISKVQNLPKNNQKLFVNLSFIWTLFTINQSGKWIYYLFMIQYTS